MEIINIPEDGKKFVDYETTSKSISFNDEELALNLAKRERDEEVHIDICSDQMGALVCGTASGLRYVAQIDIPAREYTEEEVPGEEDGETQIKRTAVPFDMDKITLTLWEMEE